MMTRDEHAALVAELATLRKQRVKFRFGAVPGSIPRLEQLLAASASDEDHAVLYALLASEYSKAKNDSLYIDCLRRRARDLPNDPMAHAGLAITLVIVQPSRRNEAITIAEKALDVAKSQDRLVRYCATNLARIGLMLDDYAVLQRALAELVADVGSDRSEDTRYEFDFVDRIDVQRFDAGLLARYKNLARIR
jgi:uncharacterized protein HemY